MVNKNLPETILRTATQEDAAAIAALADQLGYPMAPEEAARRLAVLQLDPLQVVLLAEQEGQVIGWAHVFGAPRLIDAPFAELGGLVVHADYRGRGVGSALVGAAEGWAFQQGYRTMRVRSNTLRERAPAFYHHQGYSLQKTQNVFYKRLLPDASAGGYR